MKRIGIIFAFMVAIMATSFGQRVIMAVGTDTLTNAETGYYPVASVVDLPYYGSFQGYLDHLSGSTDSTYVAIQGSVDNSHWVTLGSTLYANTVITSAAAPTDFKTCRFFTTDAGFIWNISGPLTLPYYRYAVTHYATGTVAFYGWLYKKK